LTTALELGLVAAAGGSIVSPFWLQFFEMKGCIGKDVPQRESKTHL
jgi:hypothetical protein